MIHVAFICTFANLQTCRFDYRGLIIFSELVANYNDLIWSLHFESVFSSQMRLCDGGELWMEVRDTGWKFSPGCDPMFT